MRDYFNHCGTITSMNLKTYQQDLIDQRMDKYSKMGEYKE
jgi:hypothetical protein